MRLLPAGENALLIEFADLPETMSYHRSMVRQRPDAVVDLVPAARTVLVIFDGAPAPILEWVAALEPAVDDPTAASEAVTIPVSYDGADLDDVARLTGLSVAEVVAAHTQQTWTVAFGGFAPGFGYLVGTDTRLHVPRRNSPRTSVPAGAVGLAGEFSGIYPRSSPGGWQLIGRSDVTLWDSERTPPALLTPGTTVRFEST
ncbi:allophanate hydrolase subunit 1 [Rhodococcus sp. 05-2256-B2]|uniref:5-oxoprolinase subunit B family protein n=1 Tax=Nocardiaceae TaxID=85025 RepID=UPI00050C0F98|nr:MULTISPECIES: allophanate hydrolase subunit 1 [Rhodococcus]MBY4206247.1 allophanate hydrolase subunit 1 [Rhodococcus fascians]MDP9638014.1 KipI family sensor histidine kinase inhibitor [Rhodococcus cercidiphylli]MBY4381566.1 allophanate hydrolase subunit 1 [Rhodococcus fascians]MBY4396435.1 allophanate hydrolase subunit 1 [Rhodococcus fascians]MBY4405548.1 allophanate hydrolase subunit 1 [Rhodococcus fascians]